MCVSVCVSSVYPTVIRMTLFPPHTPTPRLPCRQNIWLPRHSVNETHRHLQTISREVCVCVWLEENKHNFSHVHSCLDSVMVGIKASFVVLDLDVIQDLPNAPFSPHVFFLHLTCYISLLSLFSQGFCPIHCLFIIVGCDTNPILMFSYLKKKKDINEHVSA